MKTVREVLLWGVETLKAQKNGEARADAEVLLAWALALERSQLYLKNEVAVSMEKATVYENALQRRLQGNPVAYITGKKEFMGLCFRVDRNVLVPRPETEILVEEVLHLLKKSSDTPIVADIGTGSGNIAISIAHFTSAAKIYATDISESSLTLARVNAASCTKAQECDQAISEEMVRAKVFMRSIRFASCENIEFLRGDLCQPLFNSGLTGKIDIVVSNPPYVPTDIIESLAPEVRCEPSLALDGGHRGLATISRLIPQAWTALKPGGWLALEVGFNQTKEVTSIMRKQSFEEIYIKNDLAGIGRVVAGRKNV